MYLSDGKAQNIAKVCETENGKLLLKLKCFWDRKILIFIKHLVGY